MTEPHPRAWHRVAVPAALLLFAIAMLYTYLGSTRDIWWTPPQLAVPLTASGERVEVYVRGTPLDSLIAAGRVTVAGDATPVTSVDVRFRFNNRDRVQVQHIPAIVLFGILAGAMATLTIIWWIDPRIGRMRQPQSEG